MTNDLQTVRSRLRETALEPAGEDSALRRLRDRHRGLIEWLTTPIGRRSYKLSRI